MEVRLLGNSGNFGQKCWCGGVSRLGCNGVPEGASSGLFDVSIRVLWGLLGARRAVLKGKSGARYAVHGGVSRTDMAVCRDMPSADVVVRESLSRVCRQGSSVNGSSGSVDNGGNRNHHRGLLTERILMFNFGYT